MGGGGCVHIWMGSGSRPFKISCKLHVSLRMTNVKLNHSDSITLDYPIDYPIPIRPPTSSMTLSLFSLTLLREIELAQTHQRECNRWADAYIHNCSAHEDLPHTRTPPPPRDTPPQRNTASGTANGTANRDAGGRESSGRGPELCRWLKRQWERQCRVVDE